MTAADAPDDNPASVPFRGRPARPCCARAGGRAPCRPGADGRRDRGLPRRRLGDGPGPGRHWYWEVVGLPGPRSTTRHEHGQPGRDRHRDPGPAAPARRQGPARRQPGPVAGARARRHLRRAQGPQQLPLPRPTQPRVAGPGGVGALRHPHDPAGPAGGAAAEVGDDDHHRRPGRPHRSGGRSGVVRVCRSRPGSARALSTARTARTASPRLRRRAHARRTSS